MNRYFILSTMDFQMTRNVDDSLFFFIIQLFIPHHSLEIIIISWKKCSSSSGRIVATAKTHEFWHFLGADERTIAFGLIAASLPIKDKEKTTGWKSFWSSLVSFLYHFGNLFFGVFLATKLPKHYVIVYLLFYWARQDRQTGNLNKRKSRNQNDKTKQKQSYQNL